MSQDQDQAAIVPIEQLRADINRVDHELLKLLFERRELAKKVAIFKHDRQSPIRDTSREEDLLSKLVTDGVELGLDSHYVTRIFHHIIADSINTQQLLIQQFVNEQMRGKRSVGYLGDEGTYSFLAANKFFASDQDNTELKGFKSFDNIINGVETKSCDYGILPIENTTSGGITDTYDLLMKSSLSIVGEINYAIKHCLVSNQPGEIKDIKTIYTHPEILSQCSHFVRALDCEVVYESSSSSAMQAAKKDNSGFAAALGSEEASKIYQLHLLKKDIANNKENISRFVVIAKNPVQVAASLPCKTSIVLSTSNQPGALVECLLTFKHYAINLTKLESRPIPGNPWEELFYLDIEGNLEQNNVTEAIQALSKQARFLRVLGSYPIYIDDDTELRPEYLLAAHQTTTDLNQARAKPTQDFYNIGRTQKQEDKIITVGDLRFGEQMSYCLNISKLPDQVELEATIRRAKESGFHSLIWQPKYNQLEQHTFLNTARQACQLASQYKLPIFVAVSNQQEVEQISPLADAIVVTHANDDAAQLLQLVGRCPTPVLLERAPLASINDWLAAAEQIAATGNQQIILYQSNRNSVSDMNAPLSLNDLALIKSRSHLPLMYDLVDTNWYDINNNASIHAAKQLGLNAFCLPAQRLNLETLPNVMNQLGLLLKNKIPTLPPQ